MEYSILHISFLLDILLIKESLPRNREGLVKLLQVIEDGVENESDRSDGQYLYKLNIRIQEAIGLKKETIKIKESCLNCCVSYLRYESFKDLIIRIDQIKDLVDKTLKNTKKVLLLLPDSDNGRIKENIEKSQSKDQNFKFLEKKYNPNNWQNLLKENSSNRAVLWFVSEVIFKTEIDSLSQFFNDTNDYIARVLPYFLIDKENDLVIVKEKLNSENLIGSEDDLIILIQLLIHLQTQSSSKTKTLEKANSNISIKDTNTVILGNMKIKGKYIAERDIIFNKVKNSKK